MSQRHVGLALVSAAALVYEILLTRLFAMAQGYHFGFLAISLALLGFGASGTALALQPPRRIEQSSPERTMAFGTVGLALSLLASYLLANYLPFDAYRLAWELRQLGLLILYLLALSAPFFLAGLVQGLALALWAEQAGSLYAANLLGSGLGCALALAALQVWDIPGAVLIAALVAAGGALALAQRERRTLIGALATFIALALLLLWPPAWFDVRLSPYKALSQILTYPDARVLARRWNALARVDVVASANIRSAPGLSLSYTGDLPQQTAIILDADQVAALTARDGLSPAFLDALPVSLLYRLRPAARVFILDPGGGLDVLVALENGAATITAVEPNPLVADLITNEFAARAGNIYQNPRVQVHTGGGRNALARNPAPFDIIELALTQNFRAVTAGAFTLSENYDLTLEALQDDLAHLTPDGLLALHRWLQLPPVEELRGVALAAAALRNEGVSDVSAHLVVLRSFSTMLILAKRQPFADDEIATVKEFARSRQFDLVHFPGIRPEDANRYNMLPRDVYFTSVQEVLTDPTSFYNHYEYAVAPTSDDRPFFFHFFKWAQLPTVLALLGKTWQPFGGSGFLIVLALLLLTLALSFVLLVLPVVVMQRRQRLAQRKPLWRTLLYFGALGAGFLFVEIPLIQRFTLLLEHPIYAFTVVLLGLLIFSGLGSLVAARLPWRGALLALLAAIPLTMLLLERLTALWLAQALSVRVAGAVLMLAPLGFLLGIPFPRGVRFLGQKAPQLIPLAWAVNGFLSVISSILATLAALSWGTHAVFAGAVAAYLIALISIAHGRALS